MAVVSTILERANVLMAEFMFRDILANRPCIVLDDKSRLCRRTKEWLLEKCDISGYAAGIQLTPGYRRSQTNSFLLLNPQYERV